MKKNLIITTLLAAVLILSPPAAKQDIVLADESVQGSVVYNASESQAKISAKVGNAVNQAVTVVITKAGPGEFSYDGEDTLVDFIRTGDNGAVNYTALIPQGFSGGKYRVYLFGRNESVLDIPYFAHTNISDIKSIIPDVNSAADGSEMTNVIKTNETKLVIDGEYTESELGIIGNTLYGFKTVAKAYQQSNPQNFIIDFNLSKAIAEIKSGKDVSKVLKEYGVYFEIDYETDYISLPLEARSLLGSLLKTADYSKGNVPLVYSRLKIYSSVKTASSYQKIQSIIENEENFALINPNTEYYDKINDKSAIYLEMAKYIDSINSFDDIAPRLYTASKNVYDDINSVKLPKGNDDVGNSSIGGVSSVHIPLNPTTEVKPVIVLYDIESHWAKDEINILLQKGIVSGYADLSFKPDNAVTRAEFVKLLCEAFGITTATDVSFDDVPYDAWYQPYVKRAAGAGVVMGTSNRLFSPESYITRQDASLMLWRIIKSDTNNVSLQFSDKDKISSYASDAVAALCKAGIISGFEDFTFRPKENITRAQAAVIISKAMKGGQQ